MYLYFKQKLIVGSILLVIREIDYFVQYPTFMWHVTYTFLYCTPLEPYKQVMCFALQKWRNHEKEEMLLSFDGMSFLGAWQD